MTIFKHPATRAAGIATTLLGAIVFATPLFAASSETVPPPAWSQHTTASPTSESAENVTVETRIKELHRKLHITAAQKPQWDTLAEVMRDNAQTMANLQKQRAADAQSSSAVDVVKYYETVIQAHEDGKKKFVPPFAALYETMSAAQKKTADSLFRSREKASAAKQTASK
jgi:hypothetical protein